MSVIREVQIDATEANPQYPIAADGDSVYAKDINVSASDNGNFTGSILDYFTSLKTANTVSDRGVVFDSGYIASTEKAGASSDRKFVTALKIGKTINGVRDELVLCVTPLQDNGDIHASLTFRELL